MTTFGRVDPVPVAPPRVGTLVGAANQVVTNSDTETNADGEPVPWPKGFAFQAEPCGAGELVELECVGTTDVTPEEGCDTIIRHRPFAASYAVEFSAFGNAISDVRARTVAQARRLLLACESKQIEAEFWSGAKTQAAHADDSSDPDADDPRNRWLTDGNATLPEGTLLLGYRTALAVLERGLAGCMCGAGMIHARPDTVTLWVSDGLVERQGDLLVTKLGTLVVAGNGYDGSGPAGPGSPAPSADASWAFGTDIVQLRRGVIDDTRPPVFDHATNTYLAQVSRPVAATWSCCHIGVRVDHDVALSTTGS